MKKLISIILSVVFILSALPLSFAFAETYSGYCGAEGDGTNIRWSFDASTGTLTFSGSGAMRDWRHETDFDSYDPNLSEYIYTPWYSYRNQIRHGVIEDGITVMGNFAFSGCFNLVDVYLSKNLTNIGVGGFEGCSSLTTAELPAGIVFVGVGAFYNAITLSSISLPDGLEIIYYGAFAGCESLTEMEIPSSVYQINGAAFAYCSGIKSLVIPAGVKGVGAYTFYYCTGLRSIEFQGELTYINEAAFYKCTKLTSFTLEESITFIAEDAFSACSRLKFKCYSGSYAENYCMTYIPSSRYEVISHQYHSVSVVDPSCTTEGYTVFECSECGKTKKDSFSAALGHAIVTHSAKAPTCLENGWEQYETCSRCSHTTYREVSATGHSHQAVTTDPTCTAKGYTTHACHCGDTYVSDYVDELDHKYGDWEIREAATPEHDGILVRVCDICGAEETSSYEYVLFGDVDLDNRLTIYDAVLLMQHIEGITVLDIKVGDMNTDGVIDSLDVTLVLDALLTV